MNWSLLPSRYQLKYNNSFLNKRCYFLVLQVSPCKTLLLQVTLAHQMGAQNFAKEASAHSLTGILNLLTTKHFSPSKLSSFKNKLLQLVRNSTLNTRVFLPTFRCLNIRWNTVLLVFDISLLSVWISMKHSFSCLIYHFSVLGYQMKHFFSCCSIYYFSMFWYQMKRSFSCLVSYFLVFGYQLKHSFSCLIYNMKHFFSRLMKIKNWPCWFPQRCDCDCSA